MEKLGCIQRFVKIRKSLASSGTTRTLSRFMNSRNISPNCTIYRSTPKLNDKEKCRVKQLLVEYHEIFFKHDLDLGYS